MERKVDPERIAYARKRTADTREELAKTKGLYESYKQKILSPEWQDQEKILTQALIAVIQDYDGSPEKAAYVLGQAKALADQVGRPYTFITEYEAKMERAHKLDRAILEAEERVKTT